MSDDFSARYRLLKCVMVEDGIRTHNAQQVATGKVVMVHINDAAGPDEVDALRADLARLPQQNKNRVLETATLASGFAVVTEFLPGLTSFSAWLGRNKNDATDGGASGSAAQPFAAEPESESVTPHKPAIRVSFKRPAMPPAEVASADASAASVPAPSMPVPVPATPPAPVAIHAPAPAPVEVPASVPIATTVPTIDHLAGSTVPSQLSASPSADSFTGIFGKAAEAKATDGVEYIRSGPPAPAPIDFALHSDIKLKNFTPAGEAGMPVPSAPVTPPAAAVSGPGEFTMMFAPSNTGASPAVSAPAPAGIAEGVAPPAPPAPVLASIALADALPPALSTSAPPALAAIPPAGSVPAASIPPAQSSPSEFGWDTPAVAAAPASKAPAGEFTLLFGVPATAAPLPEQMRTSPMHEAPPPAFSPLTPEKQLESPPVEPMHRVMSGNPSYVAGINQGGGSPIANNLAGGGYGGGAHYPPAQQPSSGLNYGGAFAASPSYQNMPEFAPAPPPPSYPAAHASPMMGQDTPAAGGVGSTPGILPPPIFSGGSSSPLSALGGAAPRINASAGPSEYTQLISNGAAPVVPELKPATIKDSQKTGRRRLPTGLIIVINAVLLIATLLIFFVFRQQVPTRQTLTPARVVLPNVPTAPKIPR